METVIRKVRDMEADKRRWLEGFVGRQLLESQQVIIHVVDVGVEPELNVRSQALDTAAEIARVGRTHAAAQGTTEEELDTAIEDARRNIRARRP